MGQPTHKSLQSSFAAPPPARGNKLQGLLKPAPREPRPAPEIQQQPLVETGDANSAPPAAPQEMVVPSDAEVLQRPSVVAAESVSAVSAPPRVGRPVRSQTGATSVYLRTKAYRELVDRRQKKYRSYAQTVYDAFAFIRDTATDGQKNPAEALAELFDAGDATDPWLMPEPRSARNSAEPTVEAKIALKPREREWVEERMAEIGATHLSPFLATVLEHYLLHAKKN